MVWMNERREVKAFKLIKAAEGALVRNVDTSDPTTANEWQLVHCQGELIVE